MVNIRARNSDCICVKPIRCRKCSSDCKNCFCSCNGESPFDFLKRTKVAKTKSSNTSSHSNHRIGNKATQSNKININIDQNLAKPYSDNNNNVTDKPLHIEQNGELPQHVLIVAGNSVEKCNQDGNDTNDVFPCPKKAKRSKRKRVSLTKAPKIMNKRKLISNSINCDDDDNVSQFVPSSDSDDNCSEYFPNNQNVPSDNSTCDSRDITKQTSDEGTKTNSNQNETVTDNNPPQISRKEMSTSYNRSLRANRRRYQNNLNDTIIPSRNGSPSLDSELGNSSNGSGTRFVPTLPDLVSTSPFTDNILENNTTKVAQIIDFFNCQSHYKHNLPSFNLRAFSENLGENNHSRFIRMVKLVTEMHEKTYQLICPGPSQPTLMKNVLAKLKVSICNGITGYENHTEPLELEDSNIYKEKWERLTHALCTAQNRLTNKCIERRVLRSVLHKGVAQKDLHNLLTKYGFSFARGRIRTQASTDFQLLSSGRPINKPQVTFCTIADATIEKCINFILSDAYIVPSSYGSRQIVLSQNERVLMPKLTRKMPRILIVKDYLKETEDDNEQIKLSSLYRILNYISYSDVKNLGAIDYVTSMLVNETSEVLQSIADTFVSGNEHKIFSKYISASQIFLKHHYKNHVMKEDNICYHGVDYSLTKEKSQRSVTNCCGCKFPFFMLDKLKHIVRDTNDKPEPIKQDAMSVIDDTAQKFRLYMGHAARCRSQSFNINKVLEGCEKICENTKGEYVKGVMIIDFKMKYEARSSRESSIEHYGKRGMGWHGVAIVYFLWEIIDDEGNFGPRKYHIYINQILSDSNKQDGFVVLSLIEAATSAIINEVGYINELVLQSDNANCYQNHYVTMGMILINSKLHNKLFISEFIHSETQDGKTILDAHFAVSARHLDMFMKVWVNNGIKRIQTPRGLAFGLSSNNGVNNSMVQLVEINNEKLEEFEKTFLPLQKQLKQYFSRVNNIYFEKPSERDHEEINQYIIDGTTPSIVTKFKVQAFTGIDRAVTFTADLSKSSLTIDEASRKLLDSMIRLQHIDQQFEEHGGQGNYYYRNVAAHHRPNRCRKLNKNQQHMLSSESSDSEYSVESEASDNTSFSDNENSNMLDHRDDIRRYGIVPEDIEIFYKATMITGVNLLRQQELGLPRPFKPSEKNKQKKIKLGRKERGEDLICKAVRYASRVAASAAFYTDIGVEDEIYSVAQDYQPGNEMYFESGWARRKPHGEMYGNNYVDKYSKDLEEMFERGNRNKFDKMSAGKMRECLKQKYTGRFSIPGETDIRTFIGAESQKKKKSTSTNIPEGETIADVVVRSGRGRPKAGEHKPEWEIMLTQLVHQNMSNKPETIFHRFVPMYNRTFEDRMEVILPFKLPIDTSKGSSDKKLIKAKISQIKSRIKINAKKNLV